MLVAYWKYRKLPHNEQLSVRIVWPSGFCVYTFNRFPFRFSLLAINFNGAINGASYIRKHGVFLFTVCNVDSSCDMAHGLHRQDATCLGVCIYFIYILITAVEFKIWSIFIIFHRETKWLPTLSMLKDRIRPIWNDNRRTVHLGMN